MIARNQRCSGRVEKARFVFGRFAVKCGGVPLPRASLNQKAVRCGAERRRNELVRRVLNGSGKRIQKFIKITVPETKFLSGGPQFRTVLFQRKSAPFRKMFPPELFRKFRDGENFRLSGNGGSVAERLVARFSPEQSHCGFHAGSLEELRNFVLQLIVACGRHVVLADVCADVQTRQEENCRQCGGDEKRNDHARMATALFERSKRKLRSGTASAQNRGEKNQHQNQAQQKACSGEKSELADCLHRREEKKSECRA